MGHWQAGRHVCKMSLVGSLCAEGMIIHFKAFLLPHVSRVYHNEFEQERTPGEVVTRKKSLGPGVGIKLSPLLQGGCGAIFPKREFIAVFTEYLHNSFQIREIQALNLPEIGFSGSVSQ